MNCNVLGLEKSKAEKVANELNVLLANFQTYYQNLRGLHWNIKGKNFFVLHEKFEELYDGVQSQIDEIAERILTLGFTPLHTLEAYVKHSTITVGKDVSDDVEAVKLVINNLAELLKFERGLLETCNEAEDEGTIGLVGGFIPEQEKTIWMLRAYINA